MINNSSKINIKKYYRPDIDGLRALAIIPVIFFHLKIAGFSGGFIGVDIFFVISGYLITSIIVRELNENKFSLIRFWERRIRRILPVLFFIIIVTTIASYFITLFPTDFINYGQSLVAQSLFVINIFFMRIGDYFAAPAETITLLHTWSLAVEEQFYVLFPILLYLIYKISKKFLLPTLITIGILSLTYSIYLVNINPNEVFSIPFIPHIWGGATNASAGFYFPLARAWELLAGGLLVITTWKIKNKSVAEILSMLGVLSILSTVFFVTDKSEFPGLIALAPVLGTLAIIVANTKHKTLVSQILSHPVLVWIGLISYSLYLWHWPLIVLSQQYLNTSLTQYQSGLLFVTTFILSIFSYHLIEKPFRNKTIIKKSWQIFSFGLFSTATIVILGVTIISKDGFPNRAPEAARAIALAASDTNPREYECYRNNYRQIFGEVEACTLGEKLSNENISFVLWGDSHSNAIMPVFDKIATEEKIQGKFFTAAGCPPLVTENSLKKDPQCTTKGQMTINYIKDNNIKLVFLVSSWESYYPHFDNEGNHTISEALTETIDKISTSTQIVIMQRIPNQPEFDVRELFYDSIKTKILPTVYVYKTDYFELTKDSREAIKKLAKERNNISVIDPTNIYCSDNICSVSQNKKIIYTNGNHLNTTGAMMSKELIKPFLLKIET